MIEDIDAFVARLERCHWFDELPEDLGSEARERVSQAGVRRWPLWTGLPVVFVDSQYLLADRPFPALLDQFARTSGGAFSPTGVEEVPGRKGMRLVFHHHGQEYGVDLPEDPDEPPPALFERVNRAVADAGSALGFFELKDPSWGPIPGYALTAVSAFKAAVASHVVPGVLPQAILRSPGIEQELARLRWDAMGQETLRWTIRDHVIGTLTIPGDYHLRPRSPLEGDLSTQVLYEDTGMLLLRWGLKTDIAKLIDWSFLACGKATAFEEKRASRRGGHVVREGSFRMNGHPMCWKLVERSDAPIHLVACVPTPLFDRFASALDSFQLIADPKALEPELRAKGKGG